MPFFEWLLTMRQHPKHGPFATWAWSELSPIPRTTAKLDILLRYLEEDPLRRTQCKRAHKAWRNSGLRRAPVQVPASSTAAVA